MLFIKIRYLTSKFLQKFISDRLFTVIRYFIKYQKILNLKHPVTFNEKLAFCKIYDNSKKRTLLADKFLLKKYVADIIGNNHVIQTLYETDDVSNINFDLLPNSFIIKATHGSGWNIIVKNKNKINKQRILKKCRHFLSMNYYYHGRERQYLNMKPRIMIETLLLNDDNSVPEDYKLFCFNGVVKYIQVDLTRYSNHQRAYL